MHARRFWPQVIVPSLWSFALLADTKRHNELSLDENGKSPLEKFSRTTDEITCNDFHTWGCPVFVLVEANQSGLTGSLNGIQELGLVFILDTLHHMLVMCLWSSI